MSKSKGERAATAARSVGERLLDTPGEDFERGHLDKYRDENGEVHPDELGQTAVDRLLFVADNISGGEEKSYFAHLVAAAAELIVASTGEE